MRKTVGLLSIVLLAGVAESGSGLLAFQSPGRGSRSVDVDRSSVAFSSERLARIDAVLQEYVDQNRIAGAVALVLRDGKPVFERAIGWSDKEAGRRMTADTVFRIASQTKAITSVALLSLVEEGKIGLNDPVGRFVPSFAKTTVAARNETGVTFVPAKRSITIRDLLTHTAGISYGTQADIASLYEAKGLGPAAGFGWYTADKDEPICDTMERLGRSHSSPNRASNGFTGTTLTFWVVLSNGHRAYSLISSFVRVSPIRSA